MWREVSLGEVTTLQRGYDLPERERKPGNVPVVTSAGISGSHNTARTDGPGVVTGRCGTLGQVYFITEDFWPHNTTLFVKDFHGNDRRFVYYLLGSMSLESKSSVSAVPGVNRNDLHRLRVMRPPLPIQQRIAEILGRLDDKIEVNRRINRTLEQMAQALYKEWFVDFGPFQDGEFVESALGLIPRGWGVKGLSEVYNLTMGTSPKSEFYNEEGNGLPFHQGVSDFGERFPTHRRYCTVTERLAAQGDLLFSVRAPVGRMNIADTKLVIGRGLAAMNHKLGFNSFLLYQMKEHFKKEDSIGSGTIFQAVSKSDLEKVLLIVPTISAMQRFDQMIQRIDRQIEVCYRENAQLAATRDYLLPRLLSGALSVAAGEEMA